MGPGFTSSTAVAIAIIALAATVTTASGRANPVAVAPPDMQLAAGKPIRTIVTVNSNEVDIVAADDAGVGDLLSDLSSTRISGSAWAAETISTTPGYFDSYYAPEHVTKESLRTSSIFVPGGVVTSTITVHTTLPAVDDEVPETSSICLDVPADSTTTITTTVTSTLVVEVDELTETIFLWTTASDGKFNKPYYDDYTTFETRIKSTLVSLNQEPGALPSPTPSSTASFGVPWQNGRFYEKAKQIPLIMGRGEPDHFSIATFTTSEEPTAITIQDGLPSGYLQETDESEEGEEPSVTSATMIICYTDTPTTDSQHVFAFTISPRPSESDWPRPPLTTDGPSTTTV